jgi:uncharacterized protein YegL
LSDSARDLLAVGGEDWKVGIVTFGSYASDCCAPTADLRTFQSAVDSVSLSGTTAMDEGILRSLEMVSRAPSTADRDIVMVTDGMPDDHRISSTLDAAKRVEDKGVSLCILGIGSRNVDENFLAKMTPLKLVIEKSEGMGGKLANLLAKSAQSRAGKLREI